MKKLMVLLCVAASVNAHAQNKSFSNEDFINAVYKTIVDSGFAHYYISVIAPPCSFKKFDYDEWYKYGLQEDIPVYTLNELAENSFNNAAPRKWAEEKLTNAVCVDEEKAKSILNGFIKPAKNSNRKSAAEKVVYYFSRPAFTDDYQYAVVDMGFRCDDKQCGMGATFLFKQTDGEWKIAGKKLVWGN
jgi:hypothetical protein